MYSRVRLRSARAKEKEIIFLSPIEYLLRFVRFFSSASWSGSHVRPIATNGHLRDAIKKTRVASVYSGPVRSRRSLSQNVCSLIVITAARALPS